LDEWGKVSKIHTPDGGVERYGYDYAGNIISMIDDNRNPKRRDREPVPL